MHPALLGRGSASGLGAIGAGGRQTKPLQPPPFSWTPSHLGSLGAMPTAVTVRPPSLEDVGLLRPCGPAPPPLQRSLAAQQRAHAAAFGTAAWLETWSLETCVSAPKVRQWGSFCAISLPFSRQTSLPKIVRDFSGGFPLPFFQESTRPDFQGPSLGPKKEFVSNLPS